MSSKGCEAAGNAASELENRVEKRFGVLPNFFRLAPETPEIIEKLWGFAQAAYLDNPLPSVFKERLFVHLSRFCAVRYCIARHVGFLVGLGRPAGDPTACAQSVADVVKLLRRPFPRAQELQSRLALFTAFPALIVEMPMPDTQMEDAIFVLAGHVFLKSSDYLLCLDALARFLGPVRLQYLLLFLAFVRAAHYWTETHPEIAFEDDINKLLATHEALAECILNDPEARDAISQSLLDELPALRLKADKAIGLLAAIVDSSEDAILSETLDGIITSWNAGAERLFGYITSEAVGQHISLIIPINRRDEETVIVERIKRGQRIEQFDTLRMRKDKTTLDISLTVSPVRDASGKIVGASKIARDITQRKRMERELRESEERYRTLADALETQVQFRTRELERRNSDLRDLSGRLLESQDEERKRIARDVHDDYSQRLALLAIEVENLAKKLGDSSQGTKQQLVNVYQRLSELGADMHSLSHQLHSSTLERLGLVAGVKGFCTEFAETEHVQVDFTHENVPRNIPGDVALCLFRIVQEGLRNVKRHSGTEKANLRIEWSGESLHLTMSDHGKGFDIGAPPVGGIGICSMEERLRLLGGRLQIQSHLMQGTRIDAQLPLKIE